MTPACQQSFDYESDDNGDDDNGSSLIVRIKRIEGLRFPISSPTYHEGLVTATMGMYQSQGVQVDQGMIVDKEVRNC